MNSLLPISKHHQIGITCLLAALVICLPVSSCKRSSSKSSTGSQQVTTQKEPLTQTKAQTVISTPTPQPGPKRPKETSIEPTPETTQTAAKKTSSRRTGRLTKTKEKVPEGRSIAQKAYDRDDGSDSRAKMQMTLINKRGKKEVRDMEVAVKDYGELSKRYIRFHSPASIRDTAFLSWENDDRDDDQFLYLPALRRVRRIASSQKNKSFVNSDYTYEDLERRRVEKDRHKVLGSETVLGYSCWILESLPAKADNSQYGKRVSWIAKDNHVALRMDFYDKRNKLVKQMRVHKLSKISGIWTAMDAEVHDLERKHRTLMKIFEINYNQGIKDRVFTRRYLEKPR